MTGFACGSVPDPVDISPAPRRVMTCFKCGLFHFVPPLQPGQRVRCRRCHAVVAACRRDAVRRTLAWGIAALVMFAVTVSLPFMRIELYGRSHQMVLVNGADALDADGLWALGTLIFFFTIAAPAARIAGLTYVTLSLHRRHQPPLLWLVLRMAEWLRHWSMVEVYLLGAFVAYTKLIDLADVGVMTAGYSLAGLMLLQAITEFSFDREATWRALERRDAVFDPARLRATLRRCVAPHTRPDHMMGCLSCGFTVLGSPGATCPRCGAAVYPRKPQAIARAAALLLAAAILYIPANIFPILTAIELGRGEPSTIIGGVHQLLAAKMYPLAALVFFASIVVPAVKVLGLGLVLHTTRTRVRKRVRDRVVLFHVVEAIGRWSMIDMFMLSILVGLVQLGFVATVTPGDGALAFAAVVVLTMLAAMVFDPRLIWDAALEARR